MLLGEIPPVPQGPLKFHLLYASLLTYYCLAPRLWGLEWCQELQRHTEKFKLCCCHSFTFTAKPVKDTIEGRRCLPHCQAIAGLVVTPAEALTVYLFEVSACIPSSRQFLCVAPGCLGTHSVGQAGLEVIEC